MKENLLYRDTKPEFIQFVNELQEFEDWKDLEKHQTPNLYSKVINGVRFIFHLQPEIILLSIGFDGMVSNSFIKADELTFATVNEVFNILLTSNGKQPKNYLKDE